MKIKLLSDLHLEFRENLYDHIFDPINTDPNANKDVTLLLAGDISMGTGARRFVEEMCKHFKYVLMICGNHEYYENDLTKVNANWFAYANGGSVAMEAGPPNFYFLNNDCYILDGVRFIGGTMWTDFDGVDLITIAACQKKMHDYVSISLDGAPLLPYDVIREHDKFMEFLLKKFDEPFDGKTVVMTHHSPGNELKRMGRRGDKMGPAYFADIEEIIGNHNKAHLWVHGHTHQNWDYMINETRVVCNPYGYWGKSTNSGFDPDLILKV
jgi:predicted phosphodiesterase